MNANTPRQLQDWRGLLLSLWCVAVALPVAWVVTLAPLLVVVVVHDWLVCRVFP